MTFIEKPRLDRFFRVLYERLCSLCRNMGIKVTGNNVGVFVVKYGQAYTVGKYGMNAITIKDYEKYLDVR